MAKHRHAHYRCSPVLSLNHTLSHPYWAGCKLFQAFKYLNAFNKEKKSRKRIWISLLILSYDARKSKNETKLSIFWTLHSNAHNTYDSVYVYVWVCFVRMSPPKPIELFVHTEVCCTWTDHWIFDSTLTSANFSGACASISAFRHFISSLI